MDALGQNIKNPSCAALGLALPTHLPCGQEHEPFFHCSLDLSCNFLAECDAWQAIEHAGACETQKILDLTEILNTDHTGIDTLV